jgi:translation initiation factor IF-2
MGNYVNKAYPATPVEVLGINGPTKAGDDFVVLKSEKDAKSLCYARVQEKQEGKSPLTFVTQDSAFKDKTSKELNIIIKSDVHGSLEAIKNAISQIKHDEVKTKIILSDIGMVTETDVSLTKASNAVLIAFNVKPSKEAKKHAEQEKIAIHSYNIIYEVLDFVKNKMSGLLTPDVQEKIIGSAEILEIFKVSKVGKVAGSKVIEGEILQDSNARIIRDGTIIFSGKIGSIYREKNQAKQVSVGLECGITIKDFNDFQKKDIIEVYNSTITERRI